MKFKLSSSDGEVFEVDQEIVQQMVTIKTMLEDLGIDESQNQEVIPIYTVNCKTLQKVIQWTDFHRNCDFSQKKSDGNDEWYLQFYSMMNLDDIFQLVKAADYLEVHSLLQDSYGVVTKHIDLENCFVIQRFASQSFEEVKLAVDSFIDKHFEELSARSNFLQLPADELSDLLARDGLNVQNEAIVLKSITSWISADPEERCVHLNSLLQQVRAAYLPQHIVEEEIVSVLQRFNKVALSFQLDITNTIPRHGYEQVIITIHDYGKNMALNYFKDNKWREITKIPAEYSRDYSKLCWSAGRLYLVGGHYNKVVTEYNHRDGSWRNISGMQQRRNGHEVCVIKDRIYAVGGVVRDGRLEVLDFSVGGGGEWKYLAAMDQPRLHPGVAALDDKIIVMGGFHNSEVLRSVEVYHVEQDRWNYLSPMSIPRRGAGAAVLNGLLYVAGGMNGVHLASVECYNPDTDTWSIVANMNHPRYCLALISHEGALYAIGGYGVNTSEVYHSDTDTWTVIDNGLDTKVSLCKHGACLGIR